MENLKNKLDQWIIPLEEYNLDFLTEINYEPILNLFRTRIRTLNKNDFRFVEGAISSGATCFFGSLLVSLIQTGCMKNIDELFIYCSCYILLDHYLDDNTVSDENKTNLVKQLREFLNGNQIEEKNFILELVGKQYKNLINKIPSAEIHLKNVFEIEIKSLYSQRNPNLNKKEYLEICRQKGGLSCVAIQAILELEITEDEMDLGYCIQLIDDIIDLRDDLDLGINTIATYTYKTDKLLDSLFLFTVEKIDQLSQKYNILKPLMYLGLLFSIQINPDVYSSDLNRIKQKYFPKALNDLNKDKLNSYLNQLYL